MYLPTHFEITDEAQLFDLIEQFPLATLIRCSDVEISHLPVRLDRRRRLLEAHMPRANPLAEQSNVSVTAVFHGENGYISPSWYATKADNPKVVPTWNYAVVHVQGVLRVIHDSAWLASHLDAFTNQYEAEVGSNWRVSDAPADYREKLIAALIGVEVEITSIVGKFKLSQNRPAVDQASLRENSRTRALTTTP